MPYSLEHKTTTRAAILHSARVLFNKEGFAAVTIDAVMRHAGLTRGGFYNHFDSKSDLFTAAVASYHQISPFGPAPELAPIDLARQMVDFYLGDASLDAPELQCPLYALPSDTARLGAGPQSAYTVLIRRTRGIFLRALEHVTDRERRADAITALLVGAMTMSQACDDPQLHQALRGSARQTAHSLLDA